MIYIKTLRTDKIFSLSFPVWQGKSRSQSSLLDHARRVASRDRKLFRGREVELLEGTMRAIVALYLAIGVVLLAIGFLLPRTCSHRNSDVVSNIVFVLTWPVGLYAEVYQGQLSAQQWLHRQACEGGGRLGEKKPAPI